MTKHKSRMHFGRLICNTCSLDPDEPITPVEWPCKYAKGREARK